MKSVPVAALVVLPLLIAAPEVLSDDAPTERESWVCTVTRAGSGGEVLSRASIPLSYWVREQSCHGTVSINMGTAAEPRLWRISFWGGLDKDRASMNFSVSDTTLRWASVHDGTSSGGSFGVVETSTGWMGAGRYQIFALDGETVTAEFRPEASDGRALGDHRPTKVIEITRKNQTGKVTGRASTTWNEDSSGKIVADLALHGVPGSKGRIRLIRARFDETERAMAFRVREVIPLGPGAIHSSEVVFDVWAQLNDAGRYRIYSLDGETLEAAIRPGGPDGGDAETGG